MAILLNRTDKNFFLLCMVNAHLALNILGLHCNAVHS